MAENENYIKVDLQAEKIALSGFTDVVDEINATEDEKSFVEEYANLMAESIPQPVPAVKAIPNQTPTMATLALNNEISAEDIQKELERLKDGLSNTILPSIDAMFDSVSDQLPKKDGDKILEQRPTSAEINFVFEDRLTNITRAPIWA